MLEANVEDSDTSMAQNWESAQGHFAFQSHSKVHADDVEKLVSRLKHGGRTAASALLKLKALAEGSDAGGKDLLRKLGVLEECGTLMQRESTPDYIRALAGSIITSATNMPVASIVPDVSSGGYANVNIVVPSPFRLG